MVLLASTYDQSKYFRADDLNGDLKLRVKNVTEETIGEGADRQQKLVVWFTNDKRGLVLNRINNRTLRGAFGDDTANWAGKIIILFRLMVEMRGKMVPGLRVRIPPPKHAGQAVAPLKPKHSANGQAAATKPPDDENLEDQASPALSQTTVADDFEDDEIPF
jgi:hypothetical protein